jgi:hypothetical protein
MKHVSHPQSVGAIEAADNVGEGGNSIGNNLMTPDIKNKRRRPELLVQCNPGRRY